jgi:3-oxoacyl-[acyl-carrier protein] reductase
VGRSDDVERLFDELNKLSTPLKIVVNNAGINSERPVAIAETSDNEFDRLFQVNTRGIFFVMREAAKIIVPGGRIINLPTTVTKLNLQGYAAYFQGNGNHPR